jgi:tetratricopeptide (TPR) repeat protein
LSVSQNIAVEELRQQGLALARANELEAALESFDAALSAAEEEEVRELVTINKADVLFRLERNAPELNQLARIVMRRGNLRNVALAAYLLQRKFRNEGDFRKAAMYARISLEAAQELEHTGWTSAALVALGNIAVYDSQPEEAIGYYEKALPLLGATDEERVTLAFAVQNLGYCCLMTARTTEGVRLLHEAVELMKGSGAEGFAAESYLDLCLGYLDLDDLSRAKEFGELGLERATEVRQVRNAHYLLGEVALKAGEVASAEFHFEHLARHYPDFPNLKNLLYALDLRKMVNFKL